MVILKLLLINNGSLLLNSLRLPREYYFPFSTKLPASGSRAFLPNVHSALTLRLTTVGNLRSGLLRILQSAGVLFRMNLIW